MKSIGINSRFTLPGFLNGNVRGHRNSVLAFVFERRFQNCLATFRAYPSVINLFLREPG